VGECARFLRAMPIDAPPPHRAARRIGASLSGRYRLHRLIGVGGMAAVYAGVHRNGHAVAIKILHDRLSSDPEIERLFRREAQLANRIEHPAVVPVIDDDVSEDGCIYLVMPLLQGETLRARAERFGRTLPIPEIFAIGGALLSVLAAAHDQRIVHRDVKPENIFLGTDGRIRVLDFGIAKFFETNDPATVTRSGRAVGTPAFMAPEQALGRTRQVDGQTDLWAVAATLYTLASGRLVHEAETASEMLVQAATSEPKPLADVAPWVPPELCAVIDRALSFRKEARWDTARDMSGALSAACESALNEHIADLPPFLPLPSDVGADVHHAATLPPADVKPHDQSSRNVPGAITRTLLLAVAPTRTRRIAVGVAGLTLAASLGIFFSRQRTLFDRAHTSFAMQSGPSEHVVSAGETPRDAHVRAAEAAWLGARMNAAREEAGAALAADASSPEGYLLLVRLTSSWPDDQDRANFVRAQDRRDHLRPEDRAYLEALAPGMSVPADFVEQAKRLENLHKLSPSDLEVSIALERAWVRTNRSAESVDLLRSLAARSEAPALLLATYGEALAAADDVDGAVATLNRCVSNYPAATDCLEQLSQIELLEGRCADAERVARKELALDANATDGYFKLAFALDGQNTPLDEVSEVLDKCVEHTEASLRPMYKARFDGEIALVAGHFQEALRAQERLKAATLALTADAEHFDYAGRTMELDAELGLDEQASGAWRSYTRSRQTFQQDSYGGDNVMYLNALAASLGILPWDKWLPLRASRLAKHSDRDDLQDGPQRTWLEYFAMPARTASAAQEALAAAPQPTLLRRSDRWPLHDAAIANAFSLAGQARTAEELFQRASSSCMRLDNPIEYMHALKEYAAHLERAGETARACEVYSRILASWPGESESVTARSAAKRVGAICTAERATSQLKNENSPNLHASIRKEGTR